MHCRRQRDEILGDTILSASWKIGTIAEVAFLKTLPQELQKVVHVLLHLIRNGRNISSDDGNHMIKEGDSMIMLLMWLMTLKSIAISLIAKMAHHR